MYLSLNQLFPVLKQTLSGIYMGQFICTWTILVVVQRSSPLNQVFYHCLLLQYKTHNHRKYSSICNNSFFLIFSLPLQLPSPVNFTSSLFHNSLLLRRHCYCSDSALIPLPRSPLHLLPHQSLFLKFHYLHITTLSLTKLPYRVILTSKSYFIPLSNRFQQHLPSQRIKSNLHSMAHKVLHDLAHCLSLLTPLTYLIACYVTNDRKLVIIF